MFFGGNLSWVYVKVTWVKDPTIFALSCLQNGKKTLRWRIKCYMYLAPIRLQNWSIGAPIRVLSLRPIISRN